MRLIEDKKREEKTKFDCVRFVFISGHQHKFILKTKMIAISDYDDELEQNQHP